MKTDLYMKTTLTVIAIALLLIVVRMYENPTPVMAQRPPAQAVQHVIVDNQTVQHVIVDSIMPGLPLPVSLDTSSPFGKLHVIVDDIDARLSLQGIPVSVKPTPTITKSTGWQYYVDGCGPTTMRNAGLQGWELVQTIWAMKPGDIVYGSQGEREREVDRLTVCFWKKPL
jgi:hypothetical protein